MVVVAADVLVAAGAVAVVVDVVVAAAVVAVAFGAVVAVVVVAVVAAVLAAVLAVVAGAAAVLGGCFLRQKPRCAGGRYGAVSTRAAARFVRGAVRKLCAIVYANCGQSKVRDSIVRTR